MRRILFGLTALLMALMMTVSPAGPAGTDLLSMEAAAAAKKVTGVKLSAYNTVIVKGQKLGLEAVVSPSNATKKTVKWTSSNTKVATVTSKGVVKGIKAGTATITAKATDGSGKKAACKIKVLAKPYSITEKLVKMKIADAAKVLGFRIRRPYGHNARSVGYVKTLKSYESIRHYRGGNKMSCARSEEGESGSWGIHIKDKSLILFGVKVGMTKTQASAALKRGKWKNTAKEDYDEAYDLYYASTNRGSWVYRNRGIICILIDKKTNRVLEMNYWSREEDERYLVTGSGASSR